MRRCAFYRILLSPFTGIFLLVSAPIILPAQNLVPNPSFEVYDYCPYPWDVTGPMACIPWISVSSANYFNVCNPGPVGVPYNFRGFQYPHTGDAYVGGYQKSGGAGEPIRVQLLEPLNPATCYYVSFWTSLANQACGSDHIGVYFTEEDDGWPTGTPQIDWNEFMLDTANWMLIEGYFIAFGGEQYLTICDCYPDAVTNFDPTCPDAGPPGSLWSYYYFDDVLVEESTTQVIDVDLGGPVVECNYYTLDPGLNGVNYHWSDGSTESTLTVFTSGTYSVVVYDDNCGAGYAEVDVTILGYPAVELGPDTFYCAGDTYTIALDPDAGEYQWSDGTTSSFNTFDEPGIYSVILDDGCDISYSEFVLTELVVPDFTLGPDEILCVGDNIIYNFDPALGNFLWQDGNTFPLYVVNDAGTYALTVTNPCYSFADEIVLTELDEPDFDLGPPSDVICNDESLLLQFDPQLGNFNWQDGSTSSTYTITTPGVFALTISNPCGIESDQIEISHQNSPIVELGDLIQLCQGEVEILDVGDNSGTITWQNGSSDPQLIATSSGLYSVTVANDCGFDADSVIVDIAPSLNAFSLGPDINLCPGEELNLIISQPGVSILWNNFSTSDTVIITQAGVYAVIVSTHCQSVSDTIIVTAENEPPAIQFPDTLQICNGSSALLVPGVGNVSYIWSDGSQLPQLNVTIPGSYSLTVTNSCGADTGTVVVTEGGILLFIFLGNDTAVCLNQPYLLEPVFSNVDSWNWFDGSSGLTFQVASPGLVYVAVNNTCGTAIDSIFISSFPSLPYISLGPDTFLCKDEVISFSITMPDVDILWSNGSTSDEITVNSEGLLYVDISNHCESISDSVYVDLVEVLSLDLGPDQTICPGEMITITPEIDNVSYQWHDGSVDSFYQTSVEEIIILTVSNICGSASDTIQLTESTDGPQLDLGPDLTICEGETVTIQAGITGVTYQWHDGSADDELIVNTTGIYSLTVTNACGTDTDAIEVIITGVPPVTYLGSDTSICEGAVLILNSDNDLQTSSVWQDGSTADLFEVSSPGMYILTESNNCGFDSDTIVINVSGSMPVVDLGPDSILCAGSQITIFAGTYPDVIWQDGSTDPELVASTSGMYSVAVTNTCGFDTDTINLNFSLNPPSPNLGNDTSLCEGMTLLLNANVNGSNNMIWTDGSMENTFLVSNGGSYSVSVTNECGIGIDTIEVGMIEAPTLFDLGPDTTLCPGEFILLNSPTNAYNILWQDGSTGETMLADDATTYTLELSNECGMVEDHITVTYDYTLPVVDLDPAIEWCPGDVVVLDARQQFAASYLWNTGHTTPLITITTPGIYDVTVFTHCSTARSQTEIILSDCDEYKIFIPNVFSPNGDQLNDEFSISFNSAITIGSMRGSIFDRWGNLVYSSTEIPFRWNGKMNEELLQSGVYAYSIQIIYTLNSKEYNEVFYGDITLVK